MITYRHMLDEMPLPSDWDRKVFALDGKYTVNNFRNLLLYAKERSQYLAKGSARAVFKVTYENRPTVLKIAMNPAGLSQNDVEVGVVFDGVMGRSPVIVPGIDYDTDNERPVWIHQEFANKVSRAEFNRRTTVDPWQFGMALEDYHKGRTVASTITEQDVFTHTYELWGNLGFDEHFVMDLRGANNWGLYKNQLVILDLGFTAQSMHHYTGKVPFPKSPPRMNWSNRTKGPAQ